MEAVENGEAIGDLHFSPQFVESSGLQCQELK